jgi:hypothetical protein
MTKRVAKMEPGFIDEVYIPIGCLFVGKSKEIK